MYSHEGTAEVSDLILTLKITGEEKPRYLLDEKEMSVLRRMTIGVSQVACSNWKMHFRAVLNTIRRIPKIWRRAFFSIFDKRGRSKTPTRYQMVWYHPWCEWVILRLLLQRHRHKTLIDLDLMIMIAQILINLLSSYEKMLKLTCTKRHIIINFYEDCFFLYFLYKLNFVTATASGTNCK